MTSTLEPDLAAAADHIGAIGSAYYFDPATLAVGKEHDLDGFRFYFLGRGGVLGDVEAEVVASAFGYFHPRLIEKMWNTAKERVAPRAAARMYLSCGHEFARARFADVAGLDAFCTAAEQVNAAIDPAGLALYAGHDAEPLPEDPPARAIQLCTVLREARGSAHLLGIVAVGLHPSVAHAIRRPDAIGMFGWPDDIEISEQDRARWAEAEAITDRQMAVPFATLDDGGRRDFLAGLAGMRAVL
ncbi:MAG: hypothetical protein ABW328_11910 [Ilumatobacteraceae bacterium]